MWETWIYIIAFALAAVLANILYYFIGIYGHGKTGVYKHNKYLPPGFLIGFIWIAIFASLGYCFKLSMTGDPALLFNTDFPRGWSQSTILIIIVAAYCLAYPLLTMYLPQRYTQILNLIALFMAFALGIVVIQEYVAAFWYVLPLIVWTSYVCFADFMQYGDLLVEFNLVKHK